MGEGGLKRKVEYVVAEVVKGKSTTSRPHVAGFEFDRPNPNWVNSLDYAPTRTHNFKHVSTQTVYGRRTIPQHFPRIFTPEDSFHRK